MFLGLLSYLFNMMEQLWCCNMPTIGLYCSQLSVMGALSKGGSPQQLAFVVLVLLLSLCCFSSLLLHVTIVPISCASLQGITPVWKGNTCILSRRGLRTWSTHTAGSCVFVPFLVTLSPSPPFSALHTAAVRCCSCTEMVK